jgi:hypothetical protein
MILWLSIKDWLIAITLCILVFCILEIRKLKKTIAGETQKRLVPQLNLEFNSDIEHKDSGFHLKNESLFLARDITIENPELTLNDFGFKKTFLLKFDGIALLKPQEKIRLKLQVLDLNGEFLPDVTEKIIPHLISPSFEIRLCYSNIENIKFSVVFLKTKETFRLESSEVLA